MAARPAIGCSRMSAETERLLARMIMDNAAQLQEQALTQGATAYLRRGPATAAPAARPTVRDRPNQRFLQNTLRNLTTSNRRGDEAMLWRARDAQRGHHQRTAAGDDSEGGRTGQRGTGSGSTSSSGSDSKDDGGAGSRGRASPRPLRAARQGDDTGHQQQQQHPQQDRRRRGRSRSVSHSPPHAGPKRSRRHTSPSDTRGRPLSPPGATLRSVSRSQSPPPRSAEQPGGARRHRRGRGAESPSRSPSSGSLGAPAGGEGRRDRGRDRRRLSTSPSASRSGSDEGMGPFPQSEGRPHGSGAAPPPRRQGMQGDLTSSASPAAQGAPLVAAEWPASRRGTGPARRGDQAAGVGEGGLRTLSPRDGSVRGGAPGAEARGRDSPSRPDSPGRRDNPARRDSPGRRYSPGEPTGGVALPGSRSPSRRRSSSKSKKHKKSKKSGKDGHKHKSKKRGKGSRHEGGEGE